MADQVKDPYKQIWESRNLNNLSATKVELDNKTPEWERGVGAFVDEMQGTGYGLAALGAQGLQNIVGPNDTLKGITDWGLEGYNRNMAESQSGLQAPSVARVEDIKNASDAMDWASYQLGKGLPMLGSLALSGGIGGALGRLGVKEGVGALAKSAVGDMVKKSVVAKGLQAAEGQVVTKAMQEAAAQMVRGSISRGAMAGGFAGSFGLEGGQAFGEQVQGGAAPADAVKSAIAVGGINGALEFLPFYKVAKDIGLGEHAKRGIADIIINDSGLSKKALQLAKEVGGRVGKGAAEGIVAEGITEGLQELVSMAGERWAKNDPLFADLTKDDWSRISNAAAAGALVGGVAGGAGATVVGPQGQEQGQAAPGEITSATAPEIPVAPGIQTPVQTRAQVLAANLEQTNAAIQKAVENGDTARVEELAKAKQIYEEELTKQQEVPVQPVVEQPPEQVQEQPLVEQPPVEQASVEQPSVESPPQETPPQSEAQPTSPNDTIQLKQGETVVLSPDGQTRVMPTAEQTANLNRLMGERPSKETPLTQPTEVQDGQAQAQTEALLGQTQPAEQWDKADLATRAQWIKDTGASTDFATRKAAEWTTWDKVPPNTFQQRLPKVINPQEGGDTKYSMPLVQPVDMATDATMEEFEAVRRQFQEKQKQETPFKKWFGQGTPGVTADDSGNPVTLYHGTNNPEFNQWDSSRAGENSNHPTSGLGFFMTADQGSAARYGSNLMAVHAKIDNPYTLTDADLTNIETKDDAAKLRKKLMDQGYDGAVVTAPGGKPYVIAFESKQVKFVGNENPTNSPDFRYSMPQVKALDTEYLSAVKKGDTETAQKLVDEAAKRAGYTVGIVYHGGKFNIAADPIFKMPPGPKRKTNWQLGFGVHFAELPTEAEAYVKKGGKTQAAYLSGNIFDATQSGVLTDAELLKWPESVRKRVNAFNKKWNNPVTYAFQVAAVLDDMPPNQASQAIIEAGYAGLKYEARANIDNKAYRPFAAYVMVNSPAYIKAADHITYDTAGNVIPLSERFKQDNPDIRFSEETAGVKDYTPETFRSSIDSLMGEGWLQQAESAGLIQVIDGAGPRGESGSYDGKVLRLYTKTMPKNGSPLGVLLHEGGHTAAFKDVLGNSINDYLADIDTITRNGNKTAQMAITHATIATANVLKIPHNLTENSSIEDLKNIQTHIEQKAPGLFAEEKMAYFIQYASEAKSSPGFLRRLINQIKAWFAQTEFGKKLKEAGLGFEINEPMVIEWAKASLQKSLADAKEMVKVQNKVINEASKMPASVRVGRALEAEAVANPYYSMGLNELRQTLWTDPTDYRQDLVNKPGLLQKFRANFIDYFADMEKKAKNVYDAYSLLRNKKSALIEQSRQEYLLPLRDLIANSPWSAKEVGDMLAARHIKLDRVNLNLAERASDEFVDDLLKVLTPTKKKELEQARKFVKDGKNPDGTDYTGAGFDPAGNPIEMASSTKRKLVFDLMNKYAPFEVKNQNGEQDVRTKWERFKDGAAGYSDGGVTKGELRSVDDVLSLTSMDQAKFDRIANLFDAMNRRTLDILEEGGLITAPEHARLLADKSAYAPLRRESYNTNSEIEQLFLRAGQGGSKQLGTRTGTAELSEPVMVLQNALAKLEAAAAAAERNQANQELYHTVKADTTAWKPWFTIVDADKYVTHDEDGFLQERKATALNKADITLILNGKKLSIRPNMHNQRAIGFVRAVNNLDVQELSGPMKVLGWFNQITRWVNVSASPVFLMKNAIMDPFTAAYNIQASEAAPYTKEIFGNYGNAFRALKKVFMDGNRDQTDPDVRAVERFESAGGRTSFVEGLRAMDDSWGSFDAQVARRQGNLKQLMAAKDKWIDGIENFNILFENVMRFSTFQVLMEKGTVTESRAARISQDLTTNFSRRGYKTQALGVWWLFFNATVQGNYQVVRNLMSSKRVQAMAGGTIALALTLDLLGRALAPDDWDKIPEVDKERNIIVPIKAGGDFIKIPAPWVYNVLWRMGGLLGETLAGVKKPQDGLLDLAAMTATTFNPVSGGTLAQTISPTAADPFVQILENKNFAGNPLGPEGFPGAGKKANSEMIWSNTPKGYQSLARFVNEATGGSAAESGAIDLRPADYQVLAQFLTGSLGKFLSDTVFGTKDLFTKGIEGPKDVPIIKQFFSDPYDPIRVQKYHTNVAGVFGAHKLQQMYSKGPDRDLVKLHEVMTTRGKELAMYAQVQDVERQIKSLRTRLRVAENREDTARVKELKVKIEKVQEKFNEAYKKRVG